MRRVVLLTLTCVTMVSLLSCKGGAKSSEPRPTDPNSSAEIHELLNRVADNFTNASSMRVRLRLDVFSGQNDAVQLDAAMTYVAPTSIFGALQSSEGKTNFLIQDDRTYLSYGGDWFEIVRSSDWSTLREYQGGLINLRELSDALLNVTLVDAGSGLERVAASAHTYGFNSYIERMLESAAMDGITAYFATSAEILIDRNSELPAQIEVEGSAENGDREGTFLLRLDIADYGSSAEIPTPPSAPTPIPEAPRASSTPPPAGCAVEIQANVPDDGIGHVYTSNEKLSVTVSYSAPRCRNASAVFEGEFVSGSPRYTIVCHKQCDDAISAFFQSVQVPLDAAIGSIEIPAVSGPFPPVEEASSADRLEGFRLCRITVTFNDGALGGTFYNVRVGDGFCGRRTPTATFEPRTTN